MTEDTGALTQLRAWLANKELPENSRLPAERQLCTVLGTSRSDLRKALKVLEQEGVLWRQVGKGTFIGIRPADELTSIAALAAQSSPSEVMRARIKVEPMLAFEAALNASATHLDELRRCIKISREAGSWRKYETCDNIFHKTVAEATGNRVLIALFDQLNLVRRAVVWGRGRDRAEGPPTDHHSYLEHQRVIDAIANRDPVAAQAAMLDHLRAVEAGLIHHAHPESLASARRPARSAPYDGASAGAAE